MCFPLALGYETSYHIGYEKYAGKMKTNNNFRLFLSYLFGLTENLSEFLQSDAS